MKDIWKVEDLHITVDDVLRGQAADPDTIRTRSPQLVDIAETALEQCRKRLEPKVLHKEFQVVSQQHERLKLENGFSLSGPLVSGHLIGTNAVVGVICTIGEEIDRYAEKVVGEDIVLGLAVEGVGAAAVEALANAVCQKIANQAEIRGLQSTIPLSPGMIGWSVEDGQPVLFELMEPEEIGVILNPRQIMIPRKSLSMLIGIGQEVNQEKNICDFCAMRDTCQYQTEAPCAPTNS